MKKKVMFEKIVEFPTMIGEITAISLEKDLSFKNESFIDGNLHLKGKYKLTEASRLEEEFDYKIPIEISLIEKIDVTTANVDISDFYYEIKDNDSIVCHIELLIDALEIIDEIADERECDGDGLEPEIPHAEIINDSNTNKDNYDSNNNVERDDELMNEIVTYDEKENSNDISENNDEEKEESLFVNLNENTETYGTFIVYIVRQNETINSIIEKYNTSIEELEKYNNLQDLSIGAKLIIPLLND